MKKNINLIKQNKTIALTILLIIILAIGVFIIQKSYSLENGMVTAKASGYTSRNLYKNQWFTSSSAMSDTVLSDSAEGMTSVTFGNGPGGSVFQGFASTAVTTPTIADVAGVIEASDITSLNTIYKFTINYEKGANVSSIGKTSDSCNVTNTESCDVTLPSITAESGYNAVGWSTESGAVVGTAANSSYTIDTNNITLYANAKNGVAPSCEMSSTNNVSASQTVTLSCTSTDTIAKYYFGTKSTPEASDYIEITASSNLSETKNVTSEGTYYLLAEDSSGNISTAVSKKFYKTTFNMTSGTVSPTSVITMSGNSFNLPTPTANSGYTLNGSWYTNSSLTSGAKTYNSSFTPSNSGTLYSNAVEKVTVTYESADTSKGTVTGTTTESVTKNENPKHNVTLNPKSGYTFIGWTVNKDVTLNNDTEIKAGKIISNANLSNIKVVEDIEITAQFETASHKIGTCYWKVENEKLTIYAGDVSPCTLAKVDKNNIPWKDYKNSITSVEIGDNVIANTDSSWLFSNLPEVVTIDLSKLDMSGTTNISHIFENDPKLKTVIWPDDLSNVTNITDMFKGCTSYDPTSGNQIPDFPNVPKPTIDPNIELEASFDDDETGKTVKLPCLSGGSGLCEYEIISGDPRITLNEETGELEIPDDMPPGTYPIEIKIKDPITGEEVVVTIEIVISEKHTITYTTSDSSKGRITGTNTEKVSDGKHPKASITLEVTQGYTFVGWTADKNVILTNSSTIPKGNIINDNNMSDIVVSSDLTFTAQFEEISHMLGECFWKVENGTLSIYPATGTTCQLDEVNPNNLPWKGYVNEITSVVVEDGVIGAPNSSYLFSNLPNVETIDLSHFDTTGVEDMSHMFENDPKLKNIIFPEPFVTDNVTDINSMFKGCSSLEELDLKGWDTSSVTDMHSLFEGCTGLTKVDLSDFDTTNVEDMSRMFYGCENLEEIVIDPNKFKMDNVKDITDMFTGCDKLPQSELDKFKMAVGDNDIIPNLEVPENHPGTENDPIEFDVDDPNKVIPIDNPTNGSGQYDYEIIGDDHGVRIEDGKLIIPDNLQPGKYTITVKITDKITGRTTTIIYTFEIKQGVVPAPNKPSVSTSDASVVYGSKDVTLTCETTSTYPEGTALTYEFASNTTNTIPSNWSTQTSNTYKIDKNSSIGSKYYFCRIKARRNNVDSNYSVSDGVSVTVTNAAVTFNAGSGTLTGANTLYVKKGDSKFYKGLTSETSETIPKAEEAGYNFTGWYTGTTNGSRVIDANGKLQNVEGITSDGKWQITESITLYARYNQSEKEETPKYNGIISNFIGYLTAYRTVELKWTKVDDASGYQICYKKSSDNNYTCNNKGSLKDVNLKGGTKYDFKVAPYRKVNGKLVISPNYRTLSIYTIDKVSGLKVKKKSKNKVTVSFNKVKGTTGYKVYYSKKKNKKYKLLKFISSSKTSSNIKIKTSKKLYYKVRAYKVVNGKTIYAPLSDSKSFRLK